ncbi:DUF4252 domain-containing protein [uncultured Cyclobacterium sp.]|uniref:DUF4252 domain-containing protein n=1 Tax=uncultured Cyclobacterium sp. TaxID=453820 RepID=UPI0030EDBFB4|tara:strand:- start:64976 stop:65506 length:531 start_codon:yes stop_codon:yes gene_type:complete
MKKILFLALCLLPWLAQAQNEVIDQFYEKYRQDERFSRVYISPKLMQMAGGFLSSNADQKDEDAANLMELITKVKGIRILSAEKIGGLALFNEAMGDLKTDMYEELMDVRDKESSLKFMVREEKGRIKELLMVSGSTSEFTFMSMQGDFTYQDLNMLSENTNLPGMEAYGRAKKSK